MSYALALGFLTLPYIATAVGFTKPWLAEMKRQRWTDPAWQPVPRDSTPDPLDPANGVVFAGDSAKLLLQQCTRPTPAHIKGTWDPSQQDITQLETDLAAYLSVNDTGRTRASGFVMPPFGSYYRQYGGVTLRGGNRVIYVNAGLPGYLTDSITVNGRPSWRVSPISVCGGWQAYFGVEYDPVRRMFRGFSYNPSPD